MTVLKADYHALGCRIGKLPDLSGGTALSQFHPRVAAFRHIAAGVIPMTWMGDYEFDWTAIQEGTLLVRLEELVRTARSFWRKCDYVPVAVRMCIPANPASSQSNRDTNRTHVRVEEGQDGVPRGRIDHCMP